MKNYKMLLFPAMVGVLLHSCVVKTYTPLKASANIVPKSNSNVKGSALFEQSPSQQNKVLLYLSLSGLKPNTEHAVHLHENGECGSDDASLAGSHWNPYHKNHSKLNSTSNNFHLGDIGNIITNSDGSISFSMETDKWSLRSNDTASVINKSLIVHENADDYTSQPSGNSGKRIACGVIELIKTP